MDANRDNVYSFAVQVSDGSYHGTLDVTVTVNPESEPPSVTGRDSLSFRENTPVATRLHTYRATDPEGDPFTWHLGGLDASAFTITADSSGRGVLTFSRTPRLRQSRRVRRPRQPVPGDGAGPGRPGQHRGASRHRHGHRPERGRVGVPASSTSPSRRTGTRPWPWPPTPPPTRRASPSPAGPSRAATPATSPSTGTGKLTFRNTPDYDRPADSNRDNEYRVHRAGLRRADPRQPGRHRHRQQHQRAYPGHPQRQPHVLHLPGGSHLCPLHLSGHRPGPGTTPSPGLREEPTAASSSSTTGTGWRSGNRPITRTPRTRGGTTSTT